MTNLIIAIAEKYENTGQMISSIVPVRFCQNAESLSRFIIHEWYGWEEEYDGDKIDLLHNKNEYLVNITGGPHREMEFHFEDTRLVLTSFELDAVLVVGEK